MSKLEIKFYVKKNNIIYECACYSTPEEATPTGGTYWKIKKQGTVCYLPLWPKSMGGGTFHVPLTIKKNGIEYWLDMDVSHEEIIEFDYLEDYASRKIENYRTMSVLPKGHARALTNIVPTDSADRAFYYCQELTILNNEGNKGVENTWDVSAITTMARMFYYCKKLVSLDMQNWDVSNVTNFNNAFYYCKALTSLNLRNWKTSSMISCEYMFYYCTALRTIDISNFDTANVRYYDSSSNAYVWTAVPCWYMFTGCSNLKYIIIDNGKEEQLIRFGRSYTRGRSYNWLGIGSGTKVLVPGVIGKDMRNIIHWQYYSINNLLDDIEKYDITYNGNDITVTLDPDKFVAVNYWRKITNYSTVTELPQTAIDDLTNRVMPYRTSAMFFNMKKLTSLGGIETTWDMSNVTSTREMFHWCDKLTNIDMNGWNMLNVKSMVSMFQYCGSLRSCNVPSWNAKPRNIKSMFSSCSSIEEIDISGIDLSDITSLDTVFSDCNNLKTLRLPNCTMSNVTSLKFTFYYCCVLSDLDLSGWDTSNVTDFMGALSGVRDKDIPCTTYTWNVSKATTMQYLFNNCSGVESLDLSNWETPNLTNISSMFYETRALKILDMSNFSLSSTGIADNTFKYCNNLQYLIIGGTEFKFNMPNINCGNLNSTCKILVPEALLDTYKTAANWSNRASQFDAIEKYTIIRNNGQVIVTPNE